MCIRVSTCYNSLFCPCHRVDRPVLCVSDDDEEVLETVKKSAATTNKKAEIRPPSASKVSKRRTRATVSHCMPV